MSVETTRFARRLNGAAALAAGQAALARVPTSGLTAQPIGEQARLGLPVSRSPVVPEIRMEMTTGTKITRIVGGLLGTFYLVGVLAHDVTVSDVSERWTSQEFALRSILALILVSPLLVPSKVLRINRKIWGAFFALLLIDCLLFTWKVLSDTVWALGHGEWTQKIAFPSLGIYFWFVLVVQVVAYMRTKGTTTGRSVPPSAGASGVQSTRTCGDSDMRRILTWIIAVLYIVVGAWVTRVMTICKPIIAELHGGSQIEYSFICFTLLTSPSYVWFLLSVLFASALLVFARRARGPGLNIAFGLLLVGGIIIWSLTLGGLVFPRVVIGE